MEKRRVLALIGSLAVCAFVLCHPTVPPRDGTARPPAVVMAANSTATAADDDPMMIALRLEANAAVARLRATAIGE